MSPSLPWWAGDASLVDVECTWGRIQKMNPHLKQSCGQWEDKKNFGAALYECASLSESLRLYMNKFFLQLFLKYIPQIWQSIDFNMFSRMTIYIDLVGCVMFVGKSSRHQKMHRENTKLQYVVCSWIFFRIPDTLKVSLLHVCACVP